MVSNNVTHLSTKKEIYLIIDFYDENNFFVKELIINHLNLFKLLNRSLHLSYSCYY